MKQVSDSMTETQPRWLSQLERGILHWSFREGAGNLCLSVQDYLGLPVARITNY
jgi:hypothetical protein